MSNCGLQALQKFKDLKNVSMYTLLHLAQDNGLNLRFCKVEEKDLPLVHRPAIFHMEEGHFIFMQNGKALPKGKYSGFVLTQKTMGAVMPHSLAKQVQGGKGGGGIISTIITAIATIINPILGAAVAMGKAAHEVTGGAMGGGDEAAKKGQFWRIPLAGAGAYVGGGGLEGANVPIAGKLGTSWGAGGTAAATAAGMASSAAEIPGAIKTGDWAAPITAGISGFAGSKAAGGFKTGWESATGAAGVDPTMGQRLSEGFKTMLGRPTLPETTGGVATALPSPTRLGQTPAGYGGTVTIPGVGQAPYSTTSGGAMGAASAAGTVPAVSQAINWGTGQGFVGSEAAKKGFQIAGIPGASQYLDLSKLAAGAASLATTPPELGKTEPSELYKTYMGETSLPEPMAGELDKYVSMSIEDIMSEQNLQSDKTFRRIQESGDRRREQMTSIFARSGQNLQTSSELRDEIAKIDKETTEMLGEAEQEIRNVNLRNAIQTKQFYLSQSLQQNQYHQETAMELAKMAGRDEELQFAIENDDYEAFQDVMANLLQMGWSAFT